MCLTRGIIILRQGDVYREKIWAFVEEKVVYGDERGENPSKSQVYANKSEFYESRRCFEEKAMFPSSSPSKTMPGASLGTSWVPREATREGKMCMSPL